MRTPKNYAVVFFGHAESGRPTPIGKRVQKRHIETDHPLKVHVIAGEFARTAGIVFPGAEPGTGSVGIGFQEPKPEPHFPRKTENVFTEELSEPKTGAARTVPHTNRNRTRPWPPWFDFGVELHCTNHLEKQQRWTCISALSVIHAVSEPDVCLGPFPTSLGVRPDALQKLMLCVPFLGNR